jgi:uncharacterized membrane protein
MPTFVHWIHVMAAVIGVGGMAFLRFILMPSLGTLPPENRDILAKQIMSRFRWVNWSVIGLLLASGLYSIRQYYWEVAWGKSWALLTVKIALAFLVFLIALGLSSKSRLLEKVRAHSRTLLSIAFGLAVAVIFISAYLRRG